MIFYVQYEHMMGGSGLIGFLQILKGWKRKVPRTTSSSGSLRGPPPIRDMPKDIATQMAGILALASVRTTGYRLKPITGGCIAPFLLVSSNGAEGVKAAYAFEGLTNLAEYPFTDVKSRVLDFTFRIQPGFTD